MIQRLFIMFTFTLLLTVSQVFASMTETFPEVNAASSRSRTGVDSSRKAGDKQGKAEIQPSLRGYLEKLAAEKRLVIMLGDQSDFYRSENRLLDNIRSALPKYYVLQNSAPDMSTFAPIQPKMYFKYGDFSGNVELPVIVQSVTSKDLVLKVNIVNTILPSFNGGDDIIKVASKDTVIRVTNKSDKVAVLDKISLFYNGTIIDGILDRPFELAPAATSSEISFASILEQREELFETVRNLGAIEAQHAVTRFGIVVIYESPRNSTAKIVSQVNNYSVSERNSNAADSARLERHAASLQSGGTTVVVKKQEPAVRERYDFKIRYDTGKASVKQEYLDSLDKVGQAMVRNLHIRGVIEGHSDNVGTMEANMKLSESRANAAKHYLVTTYAIAPDRVKVEGFGMNRAVADNGTPEGRALNRRIEGKFWEEGD